MIGVINYNIGYSFKMLDTLRLGVGFFNMIVCFFLFPVFFLLIGELFALRSFSEAIECDMTEIYDEGVPVTLTVKLMILKVDGVMFFTSIVLLITSFIAYVTKQDEQMDDNGPI